MAKVPLITGFDCRLDTARLEKLQYVADRLSDSNKSKAVRLMIDFFAENLAIDEHQIEVERCI